MPRSGQELQAVRGVVSVVAGGRSGRAGRRRSRGRVRPMSVSTEEAAGLGSEFDLVAARSWHPCGILWVVTEIDRGAGAATRP